MTDDLTILASTYLDGQATDAERAQVEGDAELLAEVERLRRVRAVLRDNSDEATTAPLSTRERHLAAALDAWDRLPAESAGDATPASVDGAGVAGGASITAPVSLRDQRNKRRPAGTRLLTAAAAVLVLGGAGFVVRSALNSSTSDDSSATELISLDAAGDEAPSADVLAAEEFATEGQGSAADEVADAAAPPAAVESEAIAGGGPDQAPADLELEVLSGNADLARFANDLVLSRTAVFESQATQQAANVDPDAPRPTAPPTLPPAADLCGLVDDFVGFAFWEATGLFDDPIAVGIDIGRNEAVAYHADTCTLIARTPMP